MAIPRADTRSKAEVLLQLQRDIMPLQGFKPSQRSDHPIHLGDIDEAFPEKRFPLGAVHEFVASGNEEAAAGCGFMAALLGGIMQKERTAIWIQKDQSIFPIALNQFNLLPHHILFIRLKKEKELLWTLEEALKCSAVAAVVGEIPELSFTTSRRLQLAVEQSQVTALLLRKNARHLNTTASIARWQIQPLPSIVQDDLPGIGYLQWEVHLQKIRNGKPGNWRVQWKDGNLQTIQRPAIVFENSHIKIA